MALEMDGVNQHVQIPANEKFDVPELTACGWFWIDQHRNYNDMFGVGETVTGDSNNGNWSLFNRSDALKLTFRSYDSAGNIFNASTNADVSGGWLFIVCRYKIGEPVKLNVNGSLYTGDTPALPLQTKSGFPLHIGYANNAYGYLDGKSYDLRIYNRYLSDSEINTIKAQQGADRNADPHNDGLVGRWPMMEKPTGGLAAGIEPIFWHKCEAYNALAETGQTMSANGTPTADVAKWGNGLTGGTGASGPVIRTSLGSGTLQQYSITWTIKSRYAVTNGVKADGRTVAIWFSVGTGAYYPQIGKSGYPLWFNWGAASAEITDPAATWAAGDLVSFAITMDTSATTKTRIYINGNEVYSSTTGQSLALGNISFPGYWQAILSQWTCEDWVDNIKVYDVALTPAQVQIDMNYENRNVSETILDSTGTRLYRKPIFHNRLGSITDIEHSVIGPNGTITGSPNFSSVLFGNGTDMGVSDPPSDCIVFSDVMTINQMNNGAVTIEFWTKIKQASPAPSPNYLFVAAKEISYESMFLIVDNAGVLTCQVRDTGVKCNYTVSSTGLFALNGIYHVAMVCDKNASAQNRIKLYINNVLIPFTSFPNDSAWTMTSNTDLRNWASTANYSWMDNCKIYDYAKTDFSDRFDEFGYWQLKTQNNGAPVNEPIYNAAPVRTTGKPRRR